LQILSRNLPQGIGNKHIYTVHHISVLCVHTLPYKNEQRFLRHTIRLCISAYQLRRKISPCSRMYSVERHAERAITVLYSRPTAYSVLSYKFKPCCSDLRLYLVISYRLSIVTFPLSLRVSEILQQLSSSTPLFPTTPLVSAKISPGSPWGYADGLWAIRYEDRTCSVGLIVRAISFQDLQPMWSLSANVTDRWTVASTQVQSWGMKCRKEVGVWGGGVLSLPVESGKGTNFLVL